MFDSIISILTPFTCISRDVYERGSLSLTIIALLNGIYNNISRTYEKRCIYSLIGNMCSDYLSTRNNSKTVLKLFLSSVIDSVIALLSLAISCFHQLSGIIMAFRSELRIDPDVKFFLLQRYLV